MPNPPVSNKKTVLISGASSGIGAATAIKFSNSGYDLLLLGRNKERLESTKKLCNSNSKVALINFDLSELENNLNKINHELSLLPPLHCLVNNAAIFQYCPVDSSGIEDWSTQFSINLFSLVKLTKFIWPKFVSTGNGSIVNISSTLGLKPTSETSAYSASKAALINYTQSLAQAGGKYGIRANCVCPGIVDTPIHTFHHLNPEESLKIKNQLAPLQLLNRVGSPAEIAESIYFLGSDLSQWTTGSILTVDGGINIKND